LPEALQIFQTLSSRALIVSGTHRCGSSTPSGCSGSTSACGESADYSISDPAHTVESLFHAAHSTLADHFSEDIVISVHGMGGDGVSLSNGTKLDVDGGSLVARFAAELTGFYPDQYITTCNGYPDAMVDARLCGSTNVQGRHLNASTDSCTEADTEASQRFIHMEQTRGIRQDPGNVVSALDAVLP